MYLKDDSTDGMSRHRREHRTHTPGRGDKVGLHHVAALQRVVVLGLRPRPRP